MLRLKYLTVFILITNPFLLGASPSPSIPADSSAIRYSGYVKKDWVPAPKGMHGVAAQFQRIERLKGTAYGWDNPGTRIAIKTDSPFITAWLHYSAQHISKTARNGKGIYFVNGTTRSEWTFDASHDSILRPTEIVQVPLDVPATSGMHTYELVLPYGDSVEFLGFDIAEAAKAETPSSDLGLRYVAYGDSITQGFTASRIDHTYPYLLAQRHGWEMINLGFAGRSSNTVDSRIIGNLNPDIITILMGCNDWQGGNSLEAYRDNMEETLNHISQSCRNAQIYLITPLWVPLSWNPKNAKHDLEQYREVLRDIVRRNQYSNLHLIEGPDLIDHEDKYFDRVAVHPNDSGFSQMAQRLSQIITAP